MLLSCNKDKLSSGQKAERTKSIEQIELLRINRFFSLEAIDADLGKCNPGYTSEIDQNKFLFNINYYRNIAGLLPVELDTNLNKEAARALIMVYQNRKNTSPINSSSICYTPNGYLSYGKCVYVNGYYLSEGSKIHSFFNKENLIYTLNPQLKKVGYSQLKDLASLYCAGEEVFDRNIPKPEIILYPKAGFINYRFNEGCFRISAINGDFSNAKVIVKWKKKYLPVTIISYNLYNAFNPDYNTLYFSISESLKPDDNKVDIPLEIKVENAEVNGKKQTIEYKVTYMQNLN